MTKGIVSVGLQVWQSCYQSDVTSVSTEESLNQQLWVKKIDHFYLYISEVKC